MLILGVSYQYNYIFTKPTPYISTIKPSEGPRVSILELRAVGKAPSLEPFQAERAPDSLKN